MAEFANDLFSVAHPAAWAIREHEDHSGLLLANSESGLDRYRKGAAFKSGDQVLNISLSPSELFRALRIATEPDASAETLSETVLSELSESEGAEAGASEIIALEGGRKVALRKATNDAAEGAVALFEVARGIIALNTIAASPGEYAAAEASALAILASLEFGGTAEALIVAIDPAPPMAGPVR